MGDLSKDFSRIEFACKCGCGFDDVDQRLIDLLQGVRDIIGEPVFVTSGCRCPSHNAGSGGVPNSAHTRGTAADIRLGYCNGLHRYRLVQAALEVGAIGIGVAEGFIHVDVDDELPRPAVWSY